MQYTLIYVTISYINYMYLRKKKNLLNTIAATYKIMRFKIMTPVLK